jgi:hypothetical protein
VLCQERAVRRCALPERAVVASSGRHLAEATSACPPTAHAKARLTVVKASSAAIVAAAIPPCFGLGTPLKLLALLALLLLACLALAHLGIVSAGSWAQPSA